MSEPPCRGAGVRAVRAAGLISNRILTVSLFDLWYE